MIRICLLAAVFLTVSLPALAESFACRGINPRGEPITANIQLKTDALSCIAEKKRDCLRAAGDGGQDGSWDCAEYGPEYSVYTCQLPMARSADLGSFGKFQKARAFYAEPTTDPSHLKFSLWDSQTAGVPDFEIIWKAELTDSQQLALREPVIKFWKERNAEWLPLLCQ